MYPPEKVCELSFDWLIISYAQYAEDITKDLVKRYMIPEHKIIVYEPMNKGIRWEEERIVELRKCIGILKERNILGNMAEVGVYQGEFSKLFNYNFPDKKLYLFDTFSGFDVGKNIVDTSDFDKFKDTSIEMVLGKMKNPDNCIVRKGFFPDTANGIEDTFCLVSLDADLYEPILAGLEYFYPRLVNGGYIFVHDFGSYHFTGTKKAVYEYCEKTNAAIIPIADRGQSVIVVK